MENPSFWAQALRMKLMNNQSIEVYDLIDEINLPESDVCLDTFGDLLLSSELETRSNGDAILDGLRRPVPGGWQE